MHSIEYAVVSCSTFERSVFYTLCPSITGILSVKCMVHTHAAGVCVRLYCLFLVQVKTRFERSCLHTCRRVPHFTNPSKNLRQHLLTQGHVLLLVRNFISKMYGTYLCGWRFLCTPLLSASCICPGARGILLPPHQSTFALFCKSV